MLVFKAEMNSGDTFKNKFAFIARPDYRGITNNQAVVHFADTPVECGYNTQRCKKQLEMHFY